MTAGPVAPVIPAASRGRLRSGRPGAGRPTPLASPPGRPDVVYGFGRIDASGRVADRVTITVLGWRCGDRLTLTADAGVLIARLDPGGLVTVPPRPYIVIPASLRRRWVLWLRRAHLWRQAAGPTVTVPERQRVIYAFTGTVGQQASWPRLMSAAQLAASFRVGGLRDYRRRGRGARPNLCLTL